MTIGGANLVYEELHSLLLKVFKKRVLQVPIIEKAMLPSIIFDPDTRIVTNITEKYAIIALANPSEIDRITSLTDQGLEPYPGLILPEDVTRPAHFGFVNARDVMVESTSLKGAYCFDLGENCALWVRDLQLSFNIADHGVYEYKIDLAYILSFGELINPGNAEEYLEHLIAYSFKDWRNTAVHRKSK